MAGWVYRPKYLLFFCVFLWVFLLCLYHLLDSEQYGMKTSCVMLLIMITTTKRTVANTTTTTKTTKSTISALLSAHFERLNGFQFRICHTPFLQKPLTSTHIFPLNTFSLYTPPHPIQPCPGAVPLGLFGWCSGHTQVTEDVVATLK